MWSLLQTLNAGVELRKQTSGCLRADVPVDPSVSQLTAQLNSFRESPITPAEEDYYSNPNELSPCWKMGRRSAARRSPLAGVHPCQRISTWYESQTDAGNWPERRSASSVFPSLGRGLDPTLALPPSARRRPGKSV